MLLTHAVLPSPMIGVDPALLHLLCWWERLFPETWEVFGRSLHGRGVASSVCQYGCSTRRPGEHPSRRIRVHVKGWQEGKGSSPTHPMNHEQRLCFAKGRVISRISKFVIAMQDGARALSSIALVLLPRSSVCSPHEGYVRGR